MGIPKFFKWLTRRYPLILQNVKRDEDCPPIDNLYLDLNGIVHNCIHGNDAKKHERISQLDDFEEVWANIMVAIDEIVHIVKPQKLLFLAVDGVAPRAKMNQQRARRFRAAKDSMMLREQLMKEGKNAPELFDSNAISPGTEFMCELNRQLKFFVQYKLNTDASYQKLQRIVLSDCSVPGEGEHKMLDFIRQYKLDTINYDPNTRHCFYGADADLIMLSLLTHEPHFIIIREEHIIRKIKTGGVQRIDLQRTSNFQIIYISLLREYFALEYQELKHKISFNFNIERIIDDFAFFCFFIGNDFLPALTTLDIGEGALDLIIDFYKQCLPDMEDYITDEGLIHWDRAEPFIKLLGQQELESYSERLDKIGKQENRVLSFGSDFNQTTSVQDRKQLLNSKIKQSLYTKKLLKVNNLAQKKNTKRFKKFLLQKKYAEDDKKPTPSKMQIQQRAELTQRFFKLLQKQRESEGKVEQEEEKKEMTILDIISNLKDEYLSDLRPEEIGDSEVSDVNEEELDLEKIPGQQQNQELDAKILVQNQLIDRYEDENYKFVNDFVTQYQQDPEQAKGTFYKLKLKIDVNTEEGKKEKKRMLKKYLEGLQWVLFYYYRGAQHWRWYFPYHYAPMISDLGDDIVKNFLNGEVTIQQFEEDSNCSSINYPYTPFEQLLSILPTKSKVLLPSRYHDLILGDLNPYFPNDFDIDLNGRTVAWEAICLIPFIDEIKFLAAEKKMLSESEQFTEAEDFRNTIHFTYYSYMYNPNTKQQILPLQSTLPSLKPIPYNFVQSLLEQEYQNVGQFSFKAELHPKAVMPCYDFPSFKYLGVTSIEYDVKTFYKVDFKIVVIQVPPCPEDSSTEELEKYVNRFSKQTQQELYADFPYQNEVYPVHFEDNQISLSVYPDYYNGSSVQVKKEIINTDPARYENRLQRIRHKFMDKGISVGDFRVLVCFQRMEKIGCNKLQFYKIYNENEEEFEIVPLNLIMKKRDAQHYLNVNPRVMGIGNQYRKGKEVICLNQQLFGVIGTIQHVDVKQQTVQVKFNKELEESKIHDPFVGINCLNSQNQLFIKNDLTIKKYYTDSVIDGILGLRRGTVGKITSSFLVSFNDKITRDKQVYDLGLNIKNFTKKSHVADFVRFVQSNEVADYAHDNFNHNTHARGANHQKSFFEYSEDCVKVLKDYYILFPEVFESIAKGMNQDYKRQKPLNSLRDIFPQEEEDVAATRVRSIATWIESLPISKLPYVEMGFNALSQDLIQKLDNHKNLVKTTYSTIQLKCQEFETLSMFKIFQELYPYWASPFSKKLARDFEIGDRIMNINSSQREYVPFGLRGTVVGRTDNKVIILFDEQFLQGSNINGHCHPYKGGQMEPNQLLNLTKKFANILQKSKAIVESFTEIAPENQEEKKESSENKYRTVFIDKGEVVQGKVSEQFINERKDIDDEMPDEIFQSLTSQVKESPQIPQNQKKQYQAKPKQQQPQVEERKQYIQKEEKKQYPQAEQKKQYQKKVPIQQPEEQKLQQTPIVKEQIIIQQIPEIKSGFVVSDNALQNNPDFQSLMNLMQTAQKMEVPFSIVNQSENKQEVTDNKGEVKTTDFVPSWEKDASQSEQK